VKHVPGSTDGLDDKHLIDHYLNQGLNKFVFDRAATKCYLPTTSILLENVDKFKDQKRNFKCSFNMSGIWLEQCEKWQPDVLELFKQLAKSKNVEILGSTYYHSLASLFDKHDEFIEQIKMQTQAVKDLLGVKPVTFVNTEMLFNNLIAKTAEDLGFKVIFTEGVDRVLGWRSPNYVYSRGPVKENDVELNKRIRVLLRNYRLSDDVGYRFSSRKWDQWPLTAEKYSIWLSSTPGQCINVFMDYETFGEHQPESSGIFFFLKALPWKVFDWKNLDFVLPSEIIQNHEPVGEVDVHEANTVSWADMERDASAWLGNSMQKMAFEELRKLEPTVKQNGNTHLKFWRILQQSDHFYYMCTKWWEDGDVHKYFSPFSTPHDGFINIVSGISDIKVRLAKEIVKLDILNHKNEEIDLKEVSKGLEKKLEVKKIEEPKEILKPEIKVRKKIKKTVKTKPSAKIEKTEPYTLDFILAENVAYPKTEINIENLAEASNGLKKRVR
jgi:alpha-amylase